MPEDEIVPIVELPPETALTDQETVVFELPVTVAVNGKELAARMLADVGEMVTEIDAGVLGEEGADGVVPVLPGPDEVAAQPAHPAAITSVIRSLRSDTRISEHPRTRWQVSPVSDGR
jgi:hypothetical protein